MNEGEDTLYNPDATEDDAVKAVEEELEDAVARYAEDNLLVARVRKVLPSRSENYFWRQVFLKDPYYQKLTRDRTTSGNSFFGSAGGSLFPTVSFHVLVFKGLSPLCLFLLISVVKCHVSPLCLFICVSSKAFLHCVFFF